MKIKIQTTTAAAILTQVTADLAAATDTVAKHLAILTALHSVDKNLFKPGFEPAELLSFLKEEQAKLIETNFSTTKESNMKKKMTKKAAMEIARGVVGEIWGHGATGFGRQYFFSTPHDLNDLGPRRFSVEIKSHNFDNIRRMRTEKIQEIAQFLTK